MRVSRRERPARQPGAEQRDELAACHSITLMPADLITLAHLSVSSAMNFANSGGCQRHRLDPYTGQSRL
jgi:hypothetical protein